MTFFGIFFFIIKDVVSKQLKDWIDDTGSEGGGVDVVRIEYGRVNVNKLVE
jgi:hypothetical protein